MTTSDHAARIVACLENAEVAVQSAVDCTEDMTSWGDSEEAATDAAENHVEQIRRLLDVIERRLWQRR